MLPTVLEDAFASGEVLRADGSKTPLHSNVSREEAMRLYNLIRTLDPEVTVEIGLAQGISTLAIAQALLRNGSGGRHYVVDPFQHTDWDGVGLASLDRAGLRDHVEFYEAFPEDAVPGFPTAGFAFIDASHLFDLTILDFVLVDKRLKVGGLIGFHDLWMGSLRKVLRYILANRSYRLHHDVAPGPLSASQRRKAQIGALARRVPHADRVFRPEVLWPATELGIREGMAFIQKTGGDERRWQFHREF
jgi:predicted O-methyltransferase YrrM